MGNYSFAPAIKQPSIIPYLVRGKDIAAEFLRKYEALVDSEFKGNTNLKVLKLRELENVPTIVGSNSVVLPIVKRVAPNYRTGRPEDLQRTLNDGDTLSIKGNHYVDLGVVLDFTRRNHEMAIDFWEQIQEGAYAMALQQGLSFAPTLNKGITLEELPAVVVGYGIKNFDKGSYGLGLTINTDTRIRPAKILAGESGKFSDGEVSLETGLPSRLTGGNRTLYTSAQNIPSIDNLGLVRLYLDGDLNVDAGSGDLAYSNGNGRVVLF